MERIVYRKTLDVHKNGVQFTLQGFETADNMARKIEISLMASGDTIDLPLEQLTAVMYVTTPNATEPSINECTIKDNTIIYDVSSFIEEGITELQLKLIGTDPEGATGVLASPRFAIEVSKSNADDGGNIQQNTFTALENALAMAKGVYDKRIIRVEIDNDCMFRVIYADGTFYESDALNKLYLKGEGLVARSYAKGGTGTRTGEDTDNSMYYSNVSKSASLEAKKVREDSAEILEEVTKHGVYTAFSLDFETGELKYISPLYSFNIDNETGLLNVKGEAYVPDETISQVVGGWLDSKSEEIRSLRENLTLLESENTDKHQELTEQVGIALDVCTTLDLRFNDLSESQNELSAKHDALSKSQNELSQNVNNEMTTWGGIIENVNEEVGNLGEHVYSLVENHRKEKMTLWEGEWSEGYIFTENPEEYMLFQITLKGLGTSILAIRHGQYVRGIGGHTTGIDSVATYHFSATISNNQWTMVACNSGEPFKDGTIVPRTVSKIVGII